MNKTKDITFDTIRDIHHCYGKGQKRKTCDHIGLGSYRGPRNSVRSNPRPFVADQDIGNHQYFNESQNTHQLAQPFIEQLVSSLGHNANNFGKNVSPDLFKVIDDSCTKSIITSGSPNKIKIDTSLKSIGTKLNKIRKNGSI